MSEQRPEPKIVVDSDWKSQALAEKERLAAAEKAKAEQAKAAKPAMAAPGTSDGAIGDELGGEEMPEANFKSLLGTLITNALMYMGAFPDPQTGRAVVAPEYARFHIDLIAVLQEKSKNNLTPEEAKDVEQSLSELRMQFVELMKAVTNMAMKQRAQDSAAGAGGLGGMDLGGFDPSTTSQRLRGG